MEEVQEPMRFRRKGDERVRNPFFPDASKPKRTLLPASATTRGLAVLETPDSPNATDRNGAWRCWVLCRHRRARPLSSGRKAGGEPTCRDGGVRGAAWRTLALAPVSLFQDSAGNNRLTRRSARTRREPDCTPAPPRPLRSYATSDTWCLKSCLRLGTGTATAH